MMTAGAVLWATAGLGQIDAFQKDQDALTASTFWSQNGVKPGGQITLAVALDVQKRYHIMGHDAKDPYIPTKLEIINAPTELRSSTPIFPETQLFDFGEEGTKEKIRGFSGRTVVFIPMAMTESAKIGTADLQIRISYQACDDKVCLMPASITKLLTLSVLESSASVNNLNEDLFAALKNYKERVKVSFFGWDFSFAPSNLWLLLMVAALGGLLLNFTPCVLPLIPIKIMGLSNSASTRSRCFLLGSTMSLGVVAFWLSLAVAISSISGFNTANKLFQYPAFTISVGAIICAMAIGMCGFFPINLPTWIYRINPSQQSLAGSFLFGIMAAVLSTPCTAPFMGAAAAWATTQSAAVTLSTFAAIGLGMASPYLVLSGFPNLVHRMPRTGPASDLIKQVMGLLLLAAGAYFLGTGLAGLLAAPPDPPTQRYWWAVALFVSAAGVWLAWRTIRITGSVRNRVLFCTLGLLLVLVGFAAGIRFTAGSPIRWIYYTEQRLATVRSQQKVVVLEFTAAWCLNCHALEQTVLHDARVVKLMNSTNVAPIKIDITGRNPAGSQKLADLGRRTIPYLVIYSPSGQEVFSSDAYTVDQVVRAIETARSSP